MGARLSVALPGPATPTTPTTERPRVGVLALQGDVREHLEALAALGAPGFAVRTLEQLDAADGLIVPGGESGENARVVIRVERNGEGRAVVSVEAPDGGRTAAELAEEVLITVREFAA